MWMLFELILTLLIITTALFIHEVGHAIPALLRNKKVNVEIYMGSTSKENKLKLRLGRLTCYLSIAFSGLCRISNSDQLPAPTNKQKLLFGAGGPVISLIGFVSLYFLSHFIDGLPGIFINRIALASLITFFLTAIPFTYPSFMKNLAGYQSDGRYILNVIKEIKNQAKTIA